MPMTFKEDELPAECRSVVANAECELDLVDNAELQDDADDEQDEATESEIAPESDVPISEVEPVSITVQWDAKPPVKSGLYFVYYEINKTSYKGTSLARVFRDETRKLNVDVTGHDKEQIGNFCKRRTNVFWLPIDDEFLTDFLRLLNSEVGLTDYLPKPVLATEVDVAVEPIEATHKSVVESEHAGVMPKVKLPSKIIYHTDAGHGWLAVRRSLLRELGIEHDISSFSYQKGETVYLEEDSDCGCFFEAMVEAGYTAEQVHERIEVQQNKGRHNPIRSYDSYEPEVKPVAMKSTSAIIAGFKSGLNDESKQFVDGLQSSGKLQVAMVGF
jgi:hypothetical protein